VKRKARRVRLHLYGEPFYPSVFANDNVGVSLPVYWLATFNAMRARQVSFGRRRKC